MNCFLDQHRVCPASDLELYNEGNIPGCVMYDETQKACFIVKWFVQNTSKTIVTKFPVSPLPPEVR